MNSSVKGSALVVATGLLGLVALSGCATTGRVDRLLDNSDAVTMPFENLLVVGVHSDANARQRFESRMSRAIGLEGASASGSLSYMLSTEEINRDSVVRIAAEAGADAVLITRLVDIDRRSEIERERTRYTLERLDDIPMADFFRYEYVEYTDPMTINAVRDVVVVTDLFRVSDESLLWTVQTETINKETVLDIVDSISSAVAGALKSDRLIR